MSNKDMNYSIATAQSLVDYDPVRHLKHLRAQVGYRDGYCIYLSEDALRRLDEVIAFNEGDETAIRTA